MSEPTTINGQTFRQITGRPAAGGAVDIIGWKTLSAEDAAEGLPERVFLDRVSSAAEALRRYPTILGLKTQQPDSPAPDPGQHVGV